MTMRERTTSDKYGLRFIAVAGGKGGVGKTNIAANLAVSLSLAGRRVLVFDGDLGLANVDVVFGMAPRLTIRHALEQRRNLAEVIMPGPGGVDVIPAGSGVTELAHLPRELGAKLTMDLARLSARYDFVVIDAPAGIGNNVLRFIGLADEVLMVTTPEPTAVIDAYALTKIVLTATPHKPVRLLVNMASDPEEGRHVAASFADIARRFLRKEIACAARLPYDPNVPLAVRRQQPWTLCFPDCTASRLLRALAATFLREQTGECESGDLQVRLARWFASAETIGPPTPAGVG